MERKLKDVDNQAIGQRIREERERLGWTGEEFAEMVDLSPLYVGQLERGERRMSLETLVKVCDCCHISTDYLIYGNTAEDELGRVRINNLLSECSKKELSLVENIVNSIVSYIADESGDQE